MDQRPTLKGYKKINRAELEMKRKQVKIYEAQLKQRGKFIKQVLEKEKSQIIMDKNTSRI